MNEDDRLRIRDSRRMSLILRHRPADFRVTLDAHGWTTVEKLSRGSGLPVGRILEIAENNTRYELSDDRLKVRALHGHSVHVAYDDVVEPPSILYHGTSEANLERILESGSILPVSPAAVPLLLFPRTVCLSLFHIRDPSKVPFSFGFSSASSHRPAFCHST